MAGYHNILIPDVYSQGSAFEVSYDTRITTLESGVEFRLSKYRPEGRRKYSVLRGIASQQDILNLYEFFILRQGALNSFRFRDWMDYATNATRETNTPEGIANPPTAFDFPLSLVEPNIYQMVTIYQDVARTIIRPLQKVQISTDLIAVNGSPFFDYIINYELGQVTLGPTAPEVIESITGGCQFFVVVRFAESTDKAFSIAMQAAKNTQSLPGFDLVEDVAPDNVSQDYQYGGSHVYTGVNTSIDLVEVQGRLQSFITTGTLAVVALPPSINIPSGGPIFVIHNDPTSTHDLPILDNVPSTIATVPIGSTVEVFLINTPSGDLWIVTDP